MTVQVNPVAAKQDNSLGEIASALDVAAKVYGIKVDQEKVDALRGTEQKKALGEAQAKFIGVPKGTKDAIAHDQAVLSLPNGFNLPDDQDLALRSTMEQQSKDVIEKQNHLDILGNDLKTQYDKASEKTFDLADSWNKIDQLTKKKQPTVGEDLDLTFQAFHVQNPLAQVREYEFDTVKGLVGAGDYFEKLRRQLVEGKTGLTDQQRDQLKEASKETVYGALQTQKGTDDRYANIATSKGVSPDHVVDSRYRDLNLKFEQEFAERNKKQQLNQGLSNNSNPIPGSRLEALINARNLFEPTGTAQNNKPSPLR